MARPAATAETLTRNQRAVLEAARRLVARGRYPSVAARRAATGVHPHHARARLIALDLWPTEVMRPGRHGGQQFQIRTRPRTRKAPRRMSRPRIPVLCRGTPERLELIKRIWGEIQAAKRHRGLIA